MEWVVVDGVPPWDGRYELPLDEFQFTTREWGFIRRWTGYLPATILDGMRGADAELLAALAVIALRRNGKTDDPAAMWERFEEEKFGSFTLTSDDEELERLDPPPPASSNGNAPRSGDGSRTATASPDFGIPPATGSPDSDISVSAAATSET